MQIVKLIADQGHVQLEAVASIDWAAEHREGFLVRIAESNEDSLPYASGHLPGAVEIDWVWDVNDPVRRDDMVLAAVAAGASGS